MAAMLTFVLALVWVGASGAVGVTWSCYMDICYSDSLHFCSQEEQRCKTCTRAHCLDPERTPPDCVSACHSLMTSTTTGPDKPDTSTIRSASDSYSEDRSTSTLGNDISIGIIEVMLVIFGAVLSFLMISAFIIFWYLHDIRKRLLPRGVPRDANEEECHQLIVNSNNSNQTSPFGSSSSNDSTAPPKYQRSATKVIPSYTAKPYEVIHPGQIQPNHSLQSSDVYNEQVDSNRHYMGNTYRIMEESNENRVTPVPGNSTVRTQSVHLDEDFTQATFSTNPQLNYCDENTSPKSV